MGVWDAKNRDAKNRDAKDGSRTREIQREREGWLARSAAPAGRHAHKTAAVPHGGGGVAILFAQWKKSARE